MTWCILINTTTKYMPLVDVQVACIRRYATALDSISIFLATEKPVSNFYVNRILSYKNVHYISLQKDESEFIESRLAATSYIPDEYDYILPLQDDFWLDRAPDYRLLEDAIHILKTDLKVQSIRIMPSPAPGSFAETYRGPWKILEQTDGYKFTFQATFWRRKPYMDFLEVILKRASKDFEDSGLPRSDWSKFCVRVNVAENMKGQATFSEVCMGQDKIHLCIERPGRQPNAVFLSPWPYRPTAVVHGKLEPWALEFAYREGFSLHNWDKK